MAKNSPSEEVDRINAKFFIGKEIEFTAYKGMRTLFVVGNQSWVDVFNQLDSHKELVHVYFGANQQPLTNYEVPLRCLRSNYNVTLDVPYDFYEDSLRDPWFKLCMDVPSCALMLSVPLRKMPRHGRNVYVKVDDNLHDKTNQGVWVKQVSDMGFTSWWEYGADTPTAA